MISTNNDMRFEVTTKCNYNCIICPREKLTRKQETMSLDLFKFLFDKITGEAQQYNTLTFPGMGEPTLDDSLIDKIKYAKSKMPEIPVLILTNGSKLTPDLFKAFEDNGVSSVRVSLYGLNGETYSKVHGIQNTKMYDVVSRNLQEISRIRRKTEILLTFNLVEGSNDAVLNDWISFWKDKVDLLEVWRPHNWVDAKNYRDVKSKQLKTCGRPFNGPLQIQVDGTVNMCCFDFDGKLTLGDLKKQSLKEIFSSPLFNKLVECHMNGNYSGSGLICEHCDQRNEDKSDVMIFNSKFEIKERVKMVSTTYSKVIKE